ncbi:hypothetical protein Bca101_082472 [Brassica carinata]
MEYFPLLELPEDIQVLVVERVARVGYTIFSMCYPFLGISICLRAADAGYERAVYLHAITRVIFWSDGQYISRIPRESAERIGKLIRSVKWGWGLWHCNEFREKMAYFISYVVLSFYSCQCGNLIERQCMCLWHIDNTKDDNICGRCFWIKEVGLFFRDFEPISLLRDTRKW